MLCQYNTNMAHYCVSSSSRASAILSTVARFLSRYFRAFVRQMTRHMKKYHSASIVVPLIPGTWVVFLSTCCKKLTIRWQELLPRSPFTRPPLWLPRQLLCPCICPNAWYHPELQTISSKAPSELVGYKSCPKCVYCMRSFARSPKRLASPDSIMWMAANLST